MFSLSSVSNLSQDSMGLSGASVDLSGSLVMVMVLVCLNRCGLMQMPQTLAYIDGSEDTSCLIDFLIVQRISLVSAYML